MAWRHLPPMPLAPCTCPTDGREKLRTGCGIILSVSRLPIAAVHGKPSARGCANGRSGNKCGHQLQIRGAFNGELHT